MRSLTIIISTFVPKYVFRVKKNSLLNGSSKKNGTQLSVVFIELYFYHPTRAVYLACLCALYDERTNGPLSTYIKPIFNPKVSYFLNCSGVINAFRGKCFFVGCKY